MKKRSNAAALFDFSQAVIDLAIAHGLVAKIKQKRAKRRRRRKAKAEVKPVRKAKRETETRAIPPRRTGTDE